jgi:putative hydrolase of the HAD superfamily
MINYENITALLLDLDGTLINSEKAFYESYKEVLKKNYKINIDPKMYKSCELDKSATLLDTLRLSNNSILNISNNEIMDKVFSCYTIKFIKIITGDKVIKRFKILKKLKEKSYKMALVTTCSKYYLNILITKLNLMGLFDYIVAREDVENLKPANDAYLLTLDKLKILPDECLVLEDSERGIRAACNAKIKNIIKIEEYTKVQFNSNMCLSLKSVDDVLKKLLILNK